MKYKNHHSSCPEIRLQTILLLSANFKHDVFAFSIQRGKKQRKFCVCCNKTSKQNINVRLPCGPKELHKRLF